MGLRLTEGVAAAPVAAIVDDAAIARLVAQGLLTRTATHIALTEAAHRSSTRVLREITR